MMSMSSTQSHHETTRMPAIQTSFPSKGSSWSSSKVLGLFLHCIAIKGGASGNSKVHTPWPHVFFLTVSKRSPTGVADWSSCTLFSTSVHVLRVSESGRLVGRIAAYIRKAKRSLGTRVRVDVDPKQCVFLDLVFFRRDEWYLHTCWHATRLRLCWAIQWRRDV
jgi:hypothetical protein